MFEAQPARIRWEPNAFLVEVASELKPGDALDLGMGSGRNALYLARAGWNVTGFDTSTVGVAKARAAATEAKLALNAVEADMYAFDYGSARYDLIVVMYMGRIEPLGARIVTALRPGGHLVIEHYGGGYEPDSLPRVFPGLEVLRYSTDEGFPDYNQQTKGPVLRFHARKPSSP